MSEHPASAAAGGTAGGREPIRVLIVDDDALVRAGLTLMLKGAPDLHVVGAVADGAQVPAAVGEHCPDVVLMDIRMAGLDGIDATRRLRARRDAPEVIILTTFDADEHVFRALRAGAGGFLLKDTPPEGIVEAIRRVAAGEPSLSPSVTQGLHLPHPHQGGPGQPRPAGPGRPRRYLSSEPSLRSERRARATASGRPSGHSSRPTTPSGSSSSSAQITRLPPGHGRTRIAPLPRTSRPVCSTSSEYGGSRRTIVIVSRNPTGHTPV